MLFNANDIKSNSVEVWKQLKQLIILRNWMHFYSYHILSFNFEFRSELIIISINKVLKKMISNIKIPILMFFYWIQSLSLLIIKLHSSEWIE